jgi:hypothetical protein
MTTCKNRAWQAAHSLLICKQGVVGSSPIISTPQQPRSAPTRSAAAGTSGFARRFRATSVPLGSSAGRSGRRLAAAWTSSSRGAAMARPGQPSHAGSAAPPLARRGPYAPSTPGCSPQPPAAPPRPGSPPGHVQGRCRAAGAGGVVLHRDRVARQAEHAVESLVNAPSCPCWCGSPWKFLYELKHTMWQAGTRLSFANYGFAGWLPSYPGPRLCLRSRRSRQKRQL